MNQNDSCARARARLHCTLLGVNRDATLRRRNEFLFAGGGAERVLFAGNNEGTRGSTSCTVRARSFARRGSNCKSFRRFVPRER